MVNEKSLNKKSWKEFHSDVLKLTDCFGTFVPGVIVPCMLGGLIPATIIAKALGVNDVRPIDIERIGETRRIAYDIHGSVAGKKVLIVEDDLPTGKGALFAKKMLEERGAVVKIAAVYVLPSTKQIADYYSKELKELPDYPWKKSNSGDRKRQ